MKTANLMTDTLVHNGRTMTMQSPDLVARHYSPIQSDLYYDSRRLQLMKT